MHSSTGREGDVLPGLYADEPEGFGQGKLPALKSYEQFKKSYLKAAEKLTQNQAGEGARPPKEYDGNSDDYEPLNLSDTERKGLGSLRSATASSGHEYSVVIDGGNVGELHTDGLPDTVRVPLDGYSGGLTVLHSHTNATTLSAQDFKLLLNPKIEKNRCYRL